MSNVAGHDGSLLQPLNDSANNNGGGNGCAGIGCHNSLEYVHASVALVVGVLSSMMYLDAVDHAASQKDADFTVYCPFSHCDWLLKASCFGLNATLNAFWFHDVSSTLMKNKKKYYNLESVGYVLLSMFATVSYVVLAEQSGSPPYVLCSTALAYVFLHFTGAEEICNLGHCFVSRLKDYWHSSSLSSDEKELCRKISIILDAQRCGVGLPGSEAQSDFQGIINYYCRYLQKLENPPVDGLNKKYRRRQSAVWQLTKLLYNCGIVNFSLIGYYLGSYRLINKYLNNEYGSLFLTALCSMAFFGFVYKVSDQIMDSLFDMLPIGVSIISRDVKSNLCIFIPVTLGLIPMSYFSLVPTFELLDDVNLPVEKGSVFFWAAYVVTVIGAAPFNATGMFGLIQKGVAKLYPCEEVVNDDLRLMSAFEAGTACCSASQLSNSLKALLREAGGSSGDEDGLNEIPAGPAQGGVETL